MLAALTTLERLAKLECVVRIQGLKNVVRCIVVSNRPGVIGIGDGATVEEAVVNCIVNCKNEEINPCCQGCKKPLNGTLYNECECI